MKQADIRNATHVKVGDQMHLIASKWGIDEDGVLAKPSEGGFGVVTETGERIDMFAADSFWAHSTVKIFTVAHVPDELQQKWLQHLRDFDTAHPGCHFEVGIDGPEESAADMVKRLTVEPGLTFSKIFERAKWQKP